jgi:hypothetical protein
MGAGGLVGLRVVLWDRRLVPPVDGDSFLDEPGTLVRTRERLPGGDAAQSASLDTRPLGALLRFPVPSSPGAGGPKLAKKGLRGPGLTRCIHGGSHSRSFIAHAHHCASAKTRAWLIWQNSRGRKMPAHAMPLRPQEPKRPKGIPDGIWYFPRNLADNANARGLSPENLAAMAGISPSKITRWMQYNAGSLRKLSFVEVWALEDGMGLERGALTLPPAPFVAAKGA